MTTTYDERVTVELDAGMPDAFTWRGRRYEIRDVHGRWRIEGRWWGDGQEREYWRLEAKGGAVADLYHHRAAGHWFIERVWDGDVLTEGETA